MPGQKHQIDFSTEAERVTLLPEQSAAFLFVAKAVANDNDNMYALSLMKVEPERIIASNGHFLHVANIEHDVEPGFYLVKKLTKTKASFVKSNRPDPDFPDFDKLLATVDESSREYLPIFGDDYFPGSAYTKVVRALSADLIINYNYFMLSADIADEFSVDQSGEAGPVHIRDHSKALNAYIMPGRD